MKSIKPGRGPSMMSAIGSAAAAIFGVIWTLSAISMGAPIFFALFGVVFVLMGIGQAVYNYKNATGENRFSEYDITSSSEEPDPLNDYFGRSRRDDSHISQRKETPADTAGRRFCPYCGSEAEREHLYCSKCGKKLS
ncbi:zinc ribbon domain-containing protein [Anoxybacterium hadale]|uniref:Zinc ribbon domain-containing protein n=1 Tax=Anoxybacterium hadale TaxID=3408580 RepID=A0ACD1AEG6_9FIRM|nr:zinc ribbon domain-containing protein [Clostridiales bacterium]